MTLSVNRGNVRSNLKIDPKKKIWADATLERFINEGQKWMVEDPAMTWGFGETIGYLIPILTYQEYSKSVDDNPENFFSPYIRQLLKIQAGERILDYDLLPTIGSGSSNLPSKSTLYADRIFLNSGYDQAAVYTTLNTMDTFNGNGTWIALNDVTNISTDATTFKEGTGSVAFDLLVSQTTTNKATIFNSDMTPVDLSSFELNNGGVIFWAYLPEALKIKSFEVFIGNDPNNCYTIKQYRSNVQGQNYKAGWNRIFIPSINRGKIGDPNMASVNYSSITIQFDSTETNQTNFRIDNIQYVDKYLSYFYTQKAINLTDDTDESIVPEDFQFVYELYATFKAFSIIPGKENTSQKFFEEAKFNKNRIFEQDVYNIVQEFKMI